MIEILRDPHEEAVLSGLLFDPERHELLPDGEWIQHARKWADRPTLFVYRHKEHGTWVLADWLFSPEECSTPVCIEIEVLDGPPDTIGWLDQGYIRSRCGMTFDGQVRAIQKQIADAQYQRRAMRASSEEERSETCNWLRRSGRADMAASLESSPFVGHEEGGEQLDQMTERLQRMVHCA